MAYEVLTAFFLEAGFLGVMLFGLERVGKKLHFMATLAVAIGTLFSAFWILSANSWMHTPAGYSINDVGQFVPEDWLAIIFNPSFPYRLAHMTLAAYLTTALVVGGVAAWHLLAGRKTDAVRTMFAMAMGMVVVTAPIQAVMGDQHGLNTFEHQPAKIMALEGHFDSHPEGAPFVLFGFPDQEEAKVHWAIELPYVGSLLLKHDATAPLDGLDTVDRAEWPPVAVIFWSFRIMVGLGLLMILLGLVALYERWRGKLHDCAWLHRFALVMGPMGFVAVIAGWITTEVGRQPYTVYGLLRTADSASPLYAPALWASLIAFVVVYFAVFGAGLFYVLRLMGNAPGPHEPGLTQKPIRSAGITPAPAVEPQRVLANGDKS
jgi:cytochrome d ubiquinol oxidase subunit I